MIKDRQEVCKSVIDRKGFMEKQYSKATNNTEDTQKGFEPGTVGTIVFLHQENCPKLKGGACNPTMEIVSAADYLAFIKSENA